MMKHILYKPEDFKPHQCNDVEYIGFYVVQADFNICKNCNLANEQLEKQIECANILISQPWKIV